MDQSCHPPDACHNDMDWQWTRPQCPDLGSREDNLLFQCIDIHESTNREDNDSIDLFGVTEAGNSILVRVSGFLHYLYIDIPAGFREGDTVEYKEFLETKLAYHKSVVASVRIVMRQSLHGFQGNRKSPYLKIILTSYRYMNKVRACIEYGGANYRGLWKENGGRISTFDNIQYVLRFMIDVGLAGMGWVQIPTGRYRTVPEDDKYSNCQVEVDCHFLDIKPVKEETVYVRMAPLRVLSIHVMSADQSDCFSGLEEHPILQIANVLSTHGRDDVCSRNLFVFDICSTGPDLQTHIYETEEKMLMAWQEFMIQVDPDVIVGYGAIMFDFSYLLRRAQRLKLKDFGYWSRVKHSKYASIAVISEGRYQSYGYGPKINNIYGRIQLDLRQLIQREHSQRMYTLDAAYENLTKKSKGENSYDATSEGKEYMLESNLQFASDSLQSALSVHEVMNQSGFLLRYAELARIMGIPFEFAVSKNPHIRAMCQTFRKAHQLRVIILDSKNDRYSEDYWEEGASISPEKGYYTQPIAILSFESLYGAIIQAYNLCFSTLLSQNDIKEFDLKMNEDYFVGPSGDPFCTTKVKKGVLPRIFDDMSAARNNLKQKMNMQMATSETTRLNHRKWALEVSATSLYRLTGAAWPTSTRLPVALNTIAYSRQILEKVRTVLEAKNAKVIFGNARLVVVRFLGEEDRGEVVEMAQQAAIHVSNHLVKPISIELDKIYHPYFLLGNNQYAGLHWDNPDKYELDVKTTLNAKHNGCQLSRQAVNHVLRLILVDLDINSAKHYIRDLVSSLLQNKIDLPSLVITKQCSDADESWAYNQIAGRLKNCRASLIRPGEEISFIIVKGRGDSKYHEKAESLANIQERNLQVDARYYIDYQLFKPLKLILESVIGSDDTKALFTGDHTRSIKLSTPKAGGMMEFVKRNKRCAGCKIPLVDDQDGAATLCKSCE